MSYFSSTTKFFSSFNFFHLLYIWQQFPLPPLLQFLHTIPSIHSSSISLQQKKLPTKKKETFWKHTVWKSVGRNLCEPSTPCPTHSTSYSMDNCSALFTTTQFTISRKWKQPKCPKAEGKHIHNRILFGCQEKRKTSGKCNDSGKIVLSREIHTQKDKWCKLSLIWNQENVKEPKEEKNVSEVNSRIQVTRSGKQYVRKGTIAGEGKEVNAERLGKLPCPEVCHETVSPRNSCINKS